MEIDSYKQEFDILSNTLFSFLLSLSLSLSLSHTYILTLTLKTDALIHS